MALPDGIISVVPEQTDRFSKKPTVKGPQLKVNRFWDNLITKSPGKVTVRKSLIHASGMYSAIFIIFFEAAGDGCYDSLPRPRTVERISLTLVLHISTIPQV